MAASSSFALQTVVSRAVAGGHGSPSPSPAEHLAVPTGFSLCSLAGKGVKSSSAAAPFAASSRRGKRSGLRRPAPVRATALETVEKTATALVDKSVNTIRFLAIDAVEKANSGHPGLPMGCAPMGHILYDEVMRYNPKNPYWFNRDRFVLSAGHGCMLQYALLHLAGYDSVKVRKKSLHSSFPQDFFILVDFVPGNAEMLGRFKILEIRFSFYADVSF